MNNTSVKTLIDGMTTAAAGAFVLLMPMDSLAAIDYLPHDVPGIENCVPDDGCVPEDSFQDPHYEAVTNRFRERNLINFVVSCSNFEKEIDNWFLMQESSPRENIKYKTTELLESLLSMEDLYKARLLLEKAIEHFPGDQSFKLAKRIIAPAKIVSINESEIVGFQETIQFFRNIGADFEKKWIAVSKGQLLGISDSFRSLAEKFNEDRNVFISKIV